MASTQQDGDKTKKQLINELVEMRQRIAELGALEAQRKQAEETLRASEEKYRGLVTNVRLGVFRHSKELMGMILEANPAMADITGYSREELVGMKVLDLYVHPEERLVLLEELAATREKVTKELRWRKKDGSEMTVSVTKVAVRDNSGKILYIDGILEDITERKRMQREIEERQEYLASLLHNVPDAIVTLDTANLIVEWNPGAERLFGYTRDEMREKDLDDVITRRDVEEQARFFSKQTLSGEKIPPAEVVRYRKDGTPVDVILACSPITIGHKVEGAVAVYTDITERKRAEEKLRQVAEEWETTFDSITDLISIHDKDYKLVRVNKAFADAFKAKPEELIGRTCYEVVHGTKEPWPDCPHKQTLETKIPSVASFFDPHMGIYIEVSVSPISDETGELVGTVHVAKDITERKQTEERIQHLTEVLRAIRNVN